MAFQITTIKEAVDSTGLKCLVHGPAGAGKTVLCTTTGAPEKTLIISAESGLLSVEDFSDDGYRVGKVECFDDLKKAYDMLRQDCPFEWVCLDSISEIAEQVLSYEKKHHKDPRAAYGNLYEKMIDLLKDFRDLPCNVYMSCKQYAREEDLGNDAKRTKLVPGLPGKKLTENISYLFDEVFALRVERDGDGPFRVLQTQPDGQYECKDRSGKLDVLEYTISLEYIYNKIKSPRPSQPSQAQDTAKASAEGEAA